jgi:membrane protein DedA with SNARE-associated domain/rhodanese-related sulfurtransferase
MDLIGIVAQHGYAVAGGLLFLAALGIPLPVTLVLLAAGASAHTPFHLACLLLVTVLAGTLGDSLLFFGGRTTGWWLLAGMCRLSLNPERCIFSSAEYFYRRGPRTLLFSRFVPGLGALAAPLAGSLQMRFRRFLLYDLFGTTLYCATVLGVGFQCSGSIQRIAAALAGAGHLVLGVAAFAALAYAATLVLLTRRARRHENEVQKISAASLQQRLEALTPDALVVIADVRSHGYYDPGMRRIKNSIRVEPNRLKEELIALREFMAPDCEVYLYCSCLRDVTSVRVAHLLQQENCHTKVIEGGIKAWIKAGGALELVPEADLQHLPKFD